ncbi:MAG: TetR/AcrR family transcriptional regulator [Myxococcales bacterium]|nr:TetR/AcrR family transcriptional regulator [Myxococcales bacterium]
MARPAKFDEDQILDAALALFARGPVTASGVARELGAPSGSVYYRFASRAHLLAALWLREVQAFQDAFVAQLPPGDATVDVPQLAIWLVQWVRAHPVRARLLLLHRREDLIEGPFPTELSQRATALRDQLDAAMRDLAARWPGGPAEPSTVQFVLTGIPGAAVRPALVSGRPVPEGAEELVRRAVMGVLTLPAA